MASETAIPQHLVDRLTRKGAELLMQAYARNQAGGKGLEGVSPEEFAHKVGGRVYTEWCLQNPQADHCWGYHGQAFANWARDETHYLLEYLYRMRFKSDLEGGKFFKTSLLGEETAELDKKTYESVRDLTFSGIVAIAVPYFKKWDGRMPEENLRRSVAGFLIASGIQAP